MDKSIVVLSNDIKTDEIKRSPQSPQPTKSQSEPTKTINNANKHYIQNPKHYLTFGCDVIKTGYTFNNKYRVIRTLGSGASSTVWLCRDLRSTMDVVAVKVTNAQAESSGLCEIKYLTLLKENPRFVKLLDNFLSFSENGIHPCLVLQVLDQSLSHTIKESRGILHSNIKFTAKQVLEGLDYLHNVCGLIHSDIKPDNIYVHVNDGQVSIKIADFGCALPVNNYCDGVIQAPSYRSPEVILSLGFGPTADIWSLACVLFQLATGGRLFEPTAGEQYSRDEHHLALMIQLLGRMKEYLCLRTEKGRDFFLPDGDLRKVERLRPFGLFARLTEQCKWECEPAFLFANFLQPMLHYDPELRVSARECLKHEWLKF